MLERMFHLRENGATVRREAIGGATTVFTLSYILFVQPAVLSACGMDHGAVALATCVASAIATLLMGLLANLPVAQAPAMGHNFYFAFTVCGATVYPFIAPPLIVVGALMLRTVRSLDWDDPTEYLPAFLPIVIIPFSFSISEGIGIGSIAHALLKAASGRARELHPLMALLALLFLGRYLLLP